jgi:hypothetical protein
MNTGTRKKISEAQKAKWDSGTRKPSPPNSTSAALIARWSKRVNIPGKPKSVNNGVRNPEYRKWVYEQKEAKTKSFRADSEESKAFYSENLRKVRSMTATEESRMAAVKASQKVKDAARRTQKLSAGLGMKMHPEMFSVDARENHVSAAVFSIRSPEGIHYRFKNLRAFIRDNAGLFEDGDASWFECRQRAGRKCGTTCRAYGGITSIKPSEKKRIINGSWKGWVWVTLNERALNNAVDPVDRIAQRLSSAMTTTPETPEASEATAWAFACSAWLGSVTALLSVVWNFLSIFENSSCHAQPLAHCGGRNQQTPNEKQHRNRQHLQRNQSWSLRGHRAP